MKRAALVLSGGGAKGAFQVGALEELEQVYQWESVYGVSVGALNGALVAADALPELRAVWEGLRGNGDIYTGGLGPWRVVQLLAGWKRSIYDYEPLEELLRRELTGRRLAVPFTPGYTDLVTGRYWAFTHRHRATRQVVDQVLASALMPVVWAPYRERLVDGGLRNITPLSDAIEDGYSRMVVVLCQNGSLLQLNEDEDGHPDSWREKLDSIVDVLTRTVDVMTREILENDLRMCRKLNELVAPENDLREIELVVVRPQELLGDTLDFSPEQIRRRLELGSQAARRTLQESDT